MRSLRSFCIVSFLFLVRTMPATADPVVASVTVSVDPADATAFVPDDFDGLSVEMRALLPSPDGSRLFRPDNKRLITLFRTLGVRSLRFGGGSADSQSLPANEDLDSAFAFAHAVGAKVIYVLPQQNIDAGVQTATYLMSHYASDLACFSVGNEPGQDDNSAAHIGRVKDYISAVTAPDAAPGAMFCGCSTTPAFGTQWAADFANTLGASQRIKFVGQHFFPGGNSQLVQDPAEGRDALLGAKINGLYEELHDAFVPVVQQNHLTFRLDETNSFFYGGKADVSDTHAAALWAVDYMHWWSFHGAIGVNFHTPATLSGAKPNPYSVFVRSDKGVEVRPLAYAMKAFDLGGHGSLLPVKVQGDGSMPNLRTYAMLGSDGSLNITLINREHGDDAKSVTVSFETPNNAYQHGRIITMKADGNDVAATSGITLGGAAIESDGTWAGKWDSLPPANTDGIVFVTLAPASAAVVSLSK